MSLGKDHLASYIATLVFQIFCPVRILISSIKTNNLSAIQRALATILQNEFGSCEFVHYALRSEKGKVNNIRRQQQELSEKVINSVKVSLGSESSVLLSGPSFAYATQRLSYHAQTVEWVNSKPEFQSKKRDSQAHDSGRPFILDYSGSDDFDVLVIEGSYHYLQQVDLLQKCKELMVDGGSLIILGEFLEDDSEKIHSTLPNLSSLTQLSDRLGFELVSEADFTLDAIESVDVFKKILKQESAFPKDEDKALIFNLLDHAESEFSRGRRCYKLFRFIKVLKQAGDYALAHYGDIESFEHQEICELFEKSFETAFDHEIWRWKYELGNGKCVVARSEPSGPIVSHYGGAPRQINYFGKMDKAIQVCDVMVLPEVRLQYGKNSLFFKTAATFLEREIGNTVGHLLGFGFPNKKAMNIALRLGLYEKTDDFLEFIFPIADTKSSVEYRLLDIDSKNLAHQSAVDRLWDSMSPAFENGIIGVRNWEYVKYRYFDHPRGISGEFKRLFLSDAQGDICAAFFLKEHDRCNLIMDIICPLKDITRYILKLSLLLNEVRLKIWITKGWSKTLEVAGIIENDLGIEIPSNYWNPGPSSEILYGAWWLTAGDMDFM